MAGTLVWLIQRYRETSAWQSLSLATRRQREHFLKHATETAGNKPDRSYHHCGHQGRVRAPNKEAGTSATLPRNDARSVPLGVRRSIGQG